MTKSGDARSKAAKCSAIARSGNRCSSSVLPGSAFCFVHDPNAAEARRDASRKGGRARSNKARAAKNLPEALTPDDLQSYLALTLRGVLSGRLQPAVGSCIAALARSIVTVREATELEGRVVELEQTAGLETKKGWITR
jgi:hypothetical protein